MIIKVLRLYELTPDQLLALGSFLRGDIRPESSIEGSTWVCRRLQRPGFWSDEDLRRMTENDRRGDPVMTWVVLADDVPAGICFTHKHLEGQRMLALFVVSSAYAERERWQVADALALTALDGLIAGGAKEIVGWFPDEGFAADYARRVGMVTASPVTSVLAVRPIPYWHEDAEKMRVNIKGLQRVR